MNIETLNHWGEHFLGFAWPMLWQSSLLIVIIFALDLVSARKIRPALRHALWMIVLVKLLLPPTLALPTGVAWWLFPARPALTPVIRNATVTYDTTALPEYPALPSVAIAPPPPHLNTAGWVMLVSGAIGAGLLCWLIFKWASVGRNVHQAKTSHEFESLLDEAQQRAGLRRSLRLKLIDDNQSPAVYGLFRPVILLPCALAEKLSGKQLKAVLLHEAIHARRGDVWVNCAQTLLQIAYWWHPLLWLANARIRRLREEAVDDAVMLALRDEADAYAPTLLEVAKFAFRRPLASLGLVGILESRSALRQRVERLVDFQPPRRAGISLLSLCGIFAFSAVALPMGQAPASTTDSNSAGQPAPVSVSAHRTAVLIEGRFYWMSPGDFKTLVAALPYDPEYPNQRRADVKEFDEIIQRTHTLNFTPISRDRIQTDSGMEAILNTSNGTSGIRWDCTPFVTAGQVDLAMKARVSLVSLHDTSYFLFNEHASIENGGGVIFYASDSNNASSNLVLVVGVKTIETGTNPTSDTSIGREATYEKLSRIRLDASYRTTLDEVLADLTKRSQAYDSKNKGIRFVFSAPAHIPALDPATGMPEWFEAADIHASFTLTNVSLEQVLEAICMAADHPVKYSVEDDAVVFAPRVDSVKYEMRTFKVDVKKFRLGLEDRLPSSVIAMCLYTNAEGVSGLPNISALADKYFHSIGVDLKPPKTLFFNDRLEMLFVYAFPQDLDVIEQALLNMNVGTVPPKASGAKQPGNNRAQGEEISYAAGNFLDDPLTGTRGSQVAPSVKTDDLEKRTFSVGMAAFSSNVQMLTGQTNAFEGFRQLLVESGVDFSPPKTIFMDGLGMIFVQAAHKDLDTIKDIVARLSPPPQIHIKARFIEVPYTWDDHIPDLLSAGESSNSGYCILTASETKAVWQQLQSQNGVEELGEPEGTTLPERQMQMRATETQQVLTNFLFQQANKSKIPAVVAQAGNVEFGPIFDVTPIVFNDGYTIDLVVAIAQRLQFFGYADPKGFKGFTTNYDGNEIQLPVTLPAIQASSASAQGALLYDGQTLVLFPKEQQPLPELADEKSRERVAEHIREAEKKEGKKMLVAFVTVTLVDAAGNRIHSDHQMTFAQNDIPRQPQISDTVIMP